MSCLATARKAAREVGLSEDQIILIGDEEDESGKFRHFRRLPGFRVVSRNERVARPVELDPKNDLAYLVYSSGTTGKPKGVMLTHTNIVSNILMLVAVASGQLTPKDRAIGFLPMFHSYGKIATVSPSEREC
jgi:4-coumarate--CoA ligase